MRWYGQSECQTAAVMIRPRGEGDIDALCEVVREVHRLDGYPVVLQDNVREFVLSANCLAAWISEIEGCIVGHIALHTVWSDEVAELASHSLGQSRQALASISRLFVAASARGLGLGECLLNVAMNEAHVRGLSPVLDVVTTYVAG